MKHQTVPKRSLPQAIKLREELNSYLETITEKVLSHSKDVNDTSTSKPSGSQGTFSNQAKLQRELDEWSESSNKSDLGR